MDIDVSGFGIEASDRWAVTRMVAVATVQIPDLAWVSVKLYPHGGSHICSLVLTTRDGTSTSFKAAHPSSIKRAAASACALVKDSSRERAA